MPRVGGGNLLAQIRSIYVTIDAADASIREILESIEAQSDLRFIYADEVKPILTKVVTVREKNVSANRILDQILPDVGLQYSVGGTQVRIYQAASGSRDVAQTVSGTVISGTDNSPLAGVMIYVEGTTAGTITNGDGSYTFTIPAKSKYVTFSYVGFDTKKLHVEDTELFKLVSLAEQSNALDEVVVIGYGTQKKESMVASITSVKPSDLNITSSSLTTAFAGNIAGMISRQTSGEPGYDSASFYIRGISTFGSSNSPLIILDGVEVLSNMLNNMPPESIESFSVLKDAQATSVYGSRGANGVILITTKRGLGSKGKVNITFKTDMGFSQLPRQLDIMNASEFAQYRNDYAYFGSDANHPDVGKDTPLSGSVYSDPLSLGEGTNWINEITRTALYSNYALSLSGTSDKSSYYASFSYNDTEGIIQDSGQQRFTGRINLERQLFKWMKVGYTGSYTWRHNDQNKSSIGGTAWYSSAQYLSPLLKPNDTYNPLYYNGQKINTQRALIDLNTYYLERHSNNHAFTLKLEPVKNFTINSTFSYYLYQRHTYRYYPGTLPLKGENEGGEAYRAEWDEHSFSWETTAGYKFEKNGHSFDVLGGFSAYSFASHDFNLSGKGYMDDAILWNNMNAVQDKETYSAGTSYSKKTKTSVYARLNYNWKSRYYLTVTGRYDGASNFAANNKWAFFPSAALKWNISNENFLKDCNWIDDLSLRLSAGLTGNDAISTYRSLATLSSTTGGYLFDGSQPVAFYRSRLDSPDLTWEKTTAYNVAIDWSMFKGRLNITAEAYKSKTTDLLMSLAVAAQTGYTSRWTNIGSTSNKGIELSVESHNIVRPKFHWSTTLTLSHNEQKVDDIGSEDFISAYNSPGNNPYMMYGYVKGYPLNSLWGFKYGGTWKSAEEREENAVTKTYVSPANTDGGPRYYDTNHDGVLSREDLIYQGNADPYLYGGLQNTFYIHGFKLGVYFAYSLGGKIYNYSEIYMAGSQFANQYRYMLNAWHPVRNPNSDIPRAGAKSDAALPSDFMIHDASYLRLKNVTLSYTFDLKKKCSWMKDLTLSVSGENLFLWKKYNGFDPDVSSEGTSSTLRRMDLGAYPKPRTIIFSLQLRY